MTVNSSVHVTSSDRMISTQLIEKPSVVATVYKLPMS